MTITIDDTYLTLGSIYVSTTLPSLWLVRKHTTEDTEIDTRGRFIVIILSILPIVNVITLLILFLTTYGENIRNVLKQLWAVLKYIRNIPKNARLLQTTLHENKQLQQDNAIFQKMLQTGVDYEEAKRLCNVDFLESLP